MSDQEQLALPDSATAAIANADDDHDPQLANEPDDDLDPSEPQEEEEEEIDVDGQKLALPKTLAQKLNAERLMHKDYTQKTQTVAEERKAVAAEREAVTRHQQEAQQYITELAGVHAIDQQLAQFQALNWDDLINNGQLEDHARLKNQQEKLWHDRQRMVAGITHKQQQNALNEQQSLAKQVQEADAYFKREIPGWSPERSSRLQQYAAEQGMPQDALFQALVKVPAIAKAIHKAELFDQLEKTRTTAKPKPVVQEKPVTRITATRASAQRDPDKMPIDEWLKWRDGQRSKKR